MHEEDNSLNELLGEAVAAVDKKTETAPESASAPTGQTVPPVAVPPRLDGSDSPAPHEPAAELNFEEALDDALGDRSEDESFVELQNENQKLTAKTEELSARHLRLMADFDNFRKRNARERALERRYASEPVLRELLEVVDNMDRAMSAGAGNPKLLTDGVAMIRNQLISLLSRFGATPFDSTGKAFDPELQEAVANVPDARQEGEVIEELQKGYHFHDRILRPARVVVSAGNQRQENEGLPKSGDNP